MKSRRESTPRASVVAGAILLVAVATGTAQATEWQAWAGSQSRDSGSQALAFLPNELWIHIRQPVCYELGLNSQVFRSALTKHLRMA